VSEADILARVRIRLSQLGARIWRNNCGVLPDRRGIPIRFGVANPGGSDLIGYHTVLVTPGMVGARVAVFVACEAKAPSGVPTREQHHFLETVAADGGIAILAHSDQEAQEQLKARLAALERR
jgi:hypothetical protein